MSKIFLAILLVLVFSFSAVADFTITNGSHPKVTHGRVQQIIINFDTTGQVSSVDVQYYEGFLDKDVNFQSLGVNHLTLKAADATSFYTNYLKAVDGGVYTETWIEDQKK